ncbi:MAG: hypothetical protein QOE70_4205 [Chthoniobacter sp.]|jgi:hypothetical protein|nr:hypothetical protein [Chthoniobacter sp.]
MFAGTDFILACPHCEALAKLPLPEAGETPGMITWTDGWQTAPGLERPPRVSRCAVCGHTFWVGEARQLGFLAPGKVLEPGQEGWESAPVLASLDEAGVQQALDEGLGSFPELELELRVLRWWRGNDPFRIADAPVGYPTAPEAVANMERMIEMTTDGAEDLLLFRAEAQRQLGRFADLEETLQGVGCSDYWPAKTRLLDLSQAHSRKLDVLFLPLQEDGSPTGT